VNRTLRVPASSANLGPGFDALGIALNVYLQCRFSPAKEPAIHVSGRDADLISTREDNLIWRIARQVGGRSCDAIELWVENDIPLGKGLGSSAAAVTAGVIIGAELANLGWDRARVLNEAARIEGHPDNVAACVVGGVVASAIDSCGVTHAVRLELPGKFGVAVIVPDFRVPTSEARRVLPTSYSREDAIFNLQRSALLVAALATGDSRAFPAALEDRLHQPYRFALVPGLEDVTKLRAPGLLGCALSGAGPSILMFYERGHEGVCELAQQVFSGNGRHSEILRTEGDQRGYEIS